MTKKELEIKGNIFIDQNFNVPENYNYNHELVRKVKNLKVVGNFNYQESIKTLNVSAEIDFIITAIDARDGKEIEVDQTIEWFDQYLFAFPKDEPIDNLVLGEDFNVVDYAIEQIVLNIPINFTKNYDKLLFVGKDWTLLTEEEYQKQQESVVDPRWDKLKDFKVTE